MNDFNTVIINNLLKDKEDISLGLAEKITDMVHENFKSSNYGEYSDEELDRIIQKRTPEQFLSSMKSALTVRLEDSENKIVAFGMIVFREGHYEAKSLNVHPEYKGMGLGKKVCEIRENILQEMGIKELFIESLKFRKTLAFHQSRGFSEWPTDKKLQFTVFMRKEL